MTLSLIDIGANLADSSFRSDRDQVIDRALAAGVTRMVVTGSTGEGSRDALDVARGRPGELFSTAGVHPHHATTVDEPMLAKLRELACEPEVVAVGECGLDFYRDLSPRPVQLESFEAQIALAAELSMPVFLHEREAHESMADVLRRTRDTIPRAVVHCFTGTEQQLSTYLDMDLHIGITGWICDERRGSHLRDVVKRIPIDRLMIETDSPYLLPRTIRPKPKSRRNEPANLPHVLEAVADGMGLPPGEVADATTRNAERFFALGPRR